MFHIAKCGRCGSGSSGYREEFYATYSVAYDACRGARGSFDVFIFPRDRSERAILRLGPNLQLHFVSCQALAFILNDQCHFSQQFWQTMLTPPSPQICTGFPLGRSTTGFDQSPGNHTPRAPSSPSQTSFASKGLGDLRNISRKPWSKSADDLGKVSQTSTPALTSTDTSFQERIDQYRTNRADSVSSTAVPSPTTSPAPSQTQNYPFPTSATSDGLSSSPPHRLGVLTTSSSPSPVSAGTPPLTPAGNGQVHVRSHSFTPRLPSKLSAPKLGGLVPASPKRKGSASSEIESTIKERAAAAANYEREKNSSGGSIGSGPAPRPTFPFNLGSNKQSLQPLNTDVTTNVDRSAPSPGLLAPPQIIEPSADEDFPNSKRTSQVIFHFGLIDSYSNADQRLGTRLVTARLPDSSMLLFFARCLLPCPSDFPIYRLPNFSS